MSDEMVEACALTGTPSECVSQLEAFLASGIHLPVLLGLGDLPARRLAAEVASQI